MKNTFLLQLFQSYSLPLTVLQKSGASSDTASSVKTNGIICTYPMHPEVVNDKPDKCPKYEMIPVKKEKGKKNSLVKMM